jgi:DNA-binding cell septation regulator SpoVG
MTLSAFPISSPSSLKLTNGLMEKNMKNQLSEIQVVPVKPHDGLVGFASVVLNNCLFLGSIGIYTRPGCGYRLTYPTRKTPSGNFHIFHPINRDIAEIIEEAVIAKYEEVTTPYVRHNSNNLE